MIAFVKSLKSNIQYKIYLQLTLINYKNIAKGENGRTFDAEIKSNNPIANKNNIKNCSYGNYSISRKPYKIAGQSA